MEGLESPLVPDTPKPPLRLMRFSFEPNQPLLNEVGMYVQESRRPSTSIRFYASRQLLLQMPDYYTHEGSLQRIGRKFSTYSEPLYVAPTIRSRELDNGITRFQLRTTDQNTFDKLTSLEVKPETRFGNDIPYEHLHPMQLPNELDNQPDKGHYLFIDIASSALVGTKERRMAEHTFVSKAAANRFYLHTIALNSIRDMYPDVEASGQNTEDSIDSDNDELSEAG